MQAGLFWVPHSTLSIVPAIARRLARFARPIAMAIHHGHILSLCMHATQVRHWPYVASCLSWGITMQIWLMVLATAMLTACADSGTIKVGPDTYTISTRVPLGGPASAKGQALKEANLFCDSQGREILLDHMQSSECALHGGCGEAEIFFFCLAKGDPQLKRQKYSPDPTQKIEIDQR